MYTTGLPFYAKNCVNKAFIRLAINAIDTVFSKHVLSMLVQQSITLAHIGYVDPAKSLNKKVKQFKNT